MNSGRGPVPALRVLHCPDVVGGHAPQLARAERFLGLESRCLSLRPSPYGYEPDETLSPEGEGALARELRRVPLLWRALRQFDVVHFNFGSSIFPSRGYARPGGRNLKSLLRPLLSQLYETTLCMRDLPILKRAGKAIFVTYQGDDARQGDYCRKNFEIHFAHEVGPEYYPDGSDEQKRRAITRFAAYADGIFALNPDLLYVLPTRARFLPYASVDPRQWLPGPRQAGGRSLSVVHAPSHRQVKGTRYLAEAVQRLRSEGFPLEFTLVENMTREQARARYEMADIVVDQLLAGWYGGLAVEAMALGKPVIAYLREPDLQFIPRAMREDLPVINAHPGSIYAVLKALTARPRESLTALGMRGRAFVERWHDPVKIAGELLQEYRAALVSRASA